MESHTVEKKLDPFIPVREKKGNDHQPFPNQHQKEGGDAEREIT
jgi:hypothetical protein